MNKEFIPYEQALELKELGFNEPCIGFYRQGEVSIVFAGHYLSELELATNIDKDGAENYVCTAPLYQQAFRWFREKYELYTIIDDTFYHIYKSKRYELIAKFTRNIETYEEAELACLKKLIEIAKNK